MCQKTNNYGTSNTHIDKCMKPFIKWILTWMPKYLEIKACCCGHRKYPMTIILNNKSISVCFDAVSQEVIKRTRNFYRRDKQGYYYIPEVSGNQK